MAGAVITFCITDAMAKLLTEAMSPLQVTWSRYLVFVAILAPAIWNRARAGTMLGGNMRLQVLRALVLFGSTSFAIFGFAALPLADAVTLTMSAPLMVTALSIPFLGEKVGWRRWLAVLIGFIGVLVVTRPLGGGFRPEAFLMLAGAFCWSLAIIITRKLGAAEDVWRTMGWSSGIGLVMSTGASIPVWVWPTPADWLLILANGASNFLAQFLVIRALQLAAASLLAPVTFTNILWSSIVGFAVFGTLPDEWTLAGGAIIVSAGLYVWHRERQQSSRQGGA
ncbi:MAG: DMT family transporter [Thalassobaculales bacterium]